MKVALETGLTLAYDDAGDGGPPLLLVHGFTCDRGDMARLSAHHARDRRVVVVDLRGHGESDKPEVGYTMPELAADLVDFCRRLDLRRPTIVGHSMGGVVALALAADHPDLCSGVVAIDAPMFVPAEAAAGLAPLFEGVRGPEPQQVWAGFTASLLGPHDDPAMKARILGRIAEVPTAVVRSCVEGNFTFDADDAARRLRAPVLYVQSSDIPVDIPRLRAALPDAWIARTTGSGHFSPLEVPDQLAAMVDRFLEKAVAATAA
jgi:pimeloyl-ACP methyl ester carboxylesterase